MTTQLHTMKDDTQLDIQVVKVDADNESINGAGVDMLGYQGVVFLATCGKGEVATINMKAQQDTASNFATAADLEGTGVDFATAVATDGFGFLEIVRPAERYVRPVLVVPNLGTARPISIVSIRYGKNWLPETNSDGEIHVSPAEGVA